MKDIKLIAFDLDGTLLTTDKQVTERTKNALRAAADKGIAIVPATGRYIKTVPKVIQEMDSVSHYITVNGARVFDAKTGEIIYRAEIPLDEAVAIMEYLDGFDVTYDTYSNDFSFMTASMKERVNEYVDDYFYLQMLYNSRNAVDELKTHMRSYGHDAMKIMCYTKDMDFKAQLMKDLTQRFPDLSVTSSIKNNIEINAAGAHKGIALRKLAEMLGIDIKQTMAFGDSFNDVPLLEAAGVSVVVSNGEEEVKRLADIIAPSNDEDGVAQIIEEYVLKD